MKSTRFLIYLILSCFLTCYSCKNAQNKPPMPEKPTIAQVDAIPADAIPFHYLNDSIHVILIDGIFNGTDSATFLWDTGAGKTYVPTTYRDSLKGKDSVCLKLGGQTILYRGKIDFSDQFSQIGGKNTILTNWDVFRDKVVEISYDRKYLRVLPDTDGLEGYECIPYERKGHLYIPMTARIQGKIFDIKDVLLDTGFNGAFVVYEKDIPGIDLPPRQVLTATKEFKMSLDRKILADTVWAAGAFATDIDMHIATPNPKKLGQRVFPNLVGNGFFSHFSVVFDFKNNNLYLKPLKE